MAPTAMKTVKGHISLIQEERFCLISETGQGFLFTLAHDAPVGADDLWHFYHAQLPVVVQYEGEPDLESGVARAVCPVTGEGA